CHQYNNLPYSF
nr:immunoglobulin light chain junction region [Macaca mulatta]MOY04640.1 immunoglobulin light chain junction region [Macaca mulatta]